MVERELKKRHRLQQEELEYTQDLENHELEMRFQRAFSAACHAKRVSQELLEAQDAIAIEKMALRKKQREQKDELQHLQTVQRNYQCDEGEHDSNMLDILRRHVRNEHDREQMVERGHESHRNGSQMLWDMKGDVAGAL